MPGFDGTGPKGQGPMTGGARGYCAMPAGEVERPLGRGIYGGRGRGRGWRNCFYATGLPGWMRAQRGMPFGFAQGGRAFGGYGPAMSKEDELALLKNQANLLKEELQAVEVRVQTLSTQQDQGDR